MRSVVLVLAFLVFSPAMSAQNPVSQDPDEEPKGSIKGFEFRFKERPSFRYGDDLRLDIKTKWHLDFRDFHPDVANPPETTETFSVTRARFGIKGEVTKLFDYEVERELRGALEEDHPYHPWKDVYVDFRPAGFFRFKAGKFKIPFGMEQNTSVDSLDFVYRSRVSESLAPARERGVMLHGKFLKGEHLSYEAGVFRYDGENSNVKGEPTAGRTYVARVSGEPLRYLDRLPNTIRHIYLGFAATTGRMFEGENGIHGQTVSNLTYFDHVFVKGQRRRTGVEVAWTEGPASFKSEYIHVSEQRKEQGIRGNDLPDKISRGWYVSGSWVGFGELKSKGSGTPKDPVFVGRGAGAVEFAARLDVVTFYSASQTGVQSPSPRAANLTPNSDRTWTFGASWYLNHFVKLQANAHREWITSPSRRDFDRLSVAERNAFWTAIVRLQLAM
jgi:phosphate-selective porin OprO and OprP